MKKHLLLLFIAFALAPQSGWSQKTAPSSYMRVQLEEDKVGAKALDEKNGFRDAHFGDDISQFPNFNLKGDKQAVKAYTNPSDNLKIGEAILESVTYEFYKGKLFRITVATKGPENNTAARGVFQAQYGLGRQPNRAIPSRYWMGEKVMMAYEESPSTNEASFRILNREIDMLKTIEGVKADKKAASDL